MSDSTNHPQAHVKMSDSKSYGVISWMMHWSCGITLLVAAVIERSGDLFGMSLFFAMSGLFSQILAMRRHEFVSKRTGGEGRGYFKVPTTRKAMLTTLPFSLAGISIVLGAFILIGFIDVKQLILFVSSSTGLALSFILLVGPRLIVDR